ncbi:MAG: protein kinase, partial [Gemmatimonadales bacterium]|nr:protein kinase [Gemmatimonadales bacterium]
MEDLIARLEAALADRYHIERELGRGGMATVYLAEDLKHHRRVAVKVLKPELAAAIGPERFLREIEITGQLNHPHILPLLDSGEADGLLFYVMPYVEGESLADRLDREKQLPLEDALRITAEVADALGFAHSHNVLHRDIKPENILFEGGHAVVADFGLARAITAAGGERLTETGIAVGTPEYMSPEQVSAEREIDGRSDLYSLACVVYEMLAGEPPFTGPTTESVARQHLTAEPRSVATLRTAVPEEVSQALMKALAKAPADRFLTAEQFMEAVATPSTTPSAEPKTVERRLRGVLVGALAVVAVVVATAIVLWLRSTPAAPPGAERPRIAVLPFENLGSPEDEYFADGITEEITSRLVDVSGLHVVSRTSTVGYKNHGKPLRQVGEELKVDYVLEGT